MAKLKRKEFWGYVFQEQEDHSWRWEVGGREWRWVDNVGINLHSRLATEPEWSPVAMFAKLEYAAYFSFGWAQGFNTGFNYFRSAEGKEAGG